MDLDAAFVALNRFGLGGRPGQLKQVASDPRGWVEAQLDARAEKYSVLSDLPRATDQVAPMMQMRGARSEAEKQEARRVNRAAYVREMEARCVVAANTTQPVRERLVWFWSNHFTVSIGRVEVTGVAGSFERDVVREHLDEGFGAMLLASTRHPAMQLYLDNFRSIGPRSPAGMRGGRGHNENLAREILELHTLGVDGGYTQADVESLSMLLTGWGMDGRGSRAFHFAWERHQPGHKVLLGRTYPGRGEADGRAALADLAAHPSTATFVATKLVRHYVSDEPPPSLVEAVARRFRDTHGDLIEILREIVRSDEIWEKPLAKLKTPAELVVSTARALSYEDDGRVMMESMGWLGQEPFAAPSPQGWPDVAEAWLGPEALLSRLEWVQQVATDAVSRVDDPAAFAAAVMGPMLSERTGRAMGRARDRTAAMALFLASPEFQRR